LLRTHSMAMGLGSERGEEQFSSRTWVLDTIQSLKRRPGHIELERDLNDVHQECEAIARWVVTDSLFEENLQMKRVISDGHGSRRELRFILRILASED
jgi:hypothetical protein